MHTASPNPLTLFGHASKTQESILIPRSSSGEGIKRKQLCEPLPATRAGNSRPNTLHCGRREHFLTSGAVDEDKPMQWIGIVDGPDSQNKESRCFPIS